MRVRTAGMAGGIKEENGHESLFIGIVACGEKRRE